MRQAFISDRRDNTAGYTPAAYAELALRFGAECVFIDVDDIDAGQSSSSTLSTAAGPGSVRPDINGAWEAEVQHDWTQVKVKERCAFAGAVRAGAEGRQARSLCAPARAGRSSAG